MKTHRHFSYLLLLVIILSLAGCATNRKYTYRLEQKVKDPALRTWLETKGYAVKTKGNKMKATPQGRALRMLVLNGQNITSLQGIALFDSLDYLNCSNNMLSTLDLNGNPALVTLLCHSNKLQSLNVSCCHMLQSITCSNNQLRTILLDGNSKLTSLYALENPIDSLNLHANKDLDVLELSNSNLRHLDVSHNTHLTELLCIFCPLQDIDVSSCRDLREIYLRGTHIKTLDLSYNTALQKIFALESTLQNLTLFPGFDPVLVRLGVEDSVIVHPAK